MLCKVPVARKDLLHAAPHVRGRRAIDHPIDVFRVTAPRRRIGSLVLLVMALAVPRAAYAHGRLKGSLPASGAHLAQVPRELRLDFSESPDLTFSTVRLAGPDGQEVLLGALGYAADSHRSLVVPIAAAMAPGIYTIVWQMAGDDGHPVRGKIEFVVAPAAMGVGIAPVGVTAARPGGGAQPPSNAAMAGMHHDPVSMPEGNGFGAESIVYVLI